LQPDILQDLTRRLKTEYRLQERGAWLREGKCPQCGKNELYARAEAPWVVRCGRVNKCGYNGHAKQLFPDLFDNWSERYRATEENPTAAADAYLTHARGLNLGHLRGHFAQEQYFDRDLKIASATVRFPLPGGGWWERLIDQPHRFGKKKARFAPGKPYQGEWWAPPSLSIEQLAAAPEIWIAEGIFDAESLRLNGLAAASAMTCYNFPEAALARLAEACGSRRRPRLVWAFDGNHAGRSYIVKFVKRARALGWECAAALTAEHASAKPRDWNDLHLLRFEGETAFSKDKVEEYRWNGDVLLAETPLEKAKLIHKRRGWSSFILDHGVRTYRASVNEARVAELVTQMSADPMTAAWSHAQKREVAVDDAMAVKDIANCRPFPLYFQWDDVAQEGGYYFQVDFPGDRPSVKALVTAGQVSAAPDFGKRLAALSPAAIWEGSTDDLVRMRRSWTHIREVRTTYVTGYVREHGVYIFPDHAVAGGKIHPINEEDYFEVGKLAVKPTSSERILDIHWPGSEYRCDWLLDWHEAFGERGIAALAFWFGTLFAEQIRAKQQSWPFMEFWGEPAGGKTTIIELLWKLFGRVDYEGFDPSKSTPAARARNLGKVGNLPVVLIESDRQDDGRQHSKQFDWDELKTAYNGRSVRSRGVANGGMDTFEPPFRGAIVISQNDPVNASPAIMERICSMEFAKRHHSPATRKGLDRLLDRDVETLSGFILHAVRQEQPVLERFFAAFAIRERELITAGKTRNQRLIKNHGQMLAALDALVPLVAMPAWMHEKAAAQIVAMCWERAEQISADHPVVQRFWELVDYLIEVETATPDGGGYLDHSRTPDTIAIRLVEFELRCTARRLEMPAMADLKKHLKTSRSPKFIAAKPVNSRNTGTAVHCWVFQRNPTGKD
jgi:hypothetical protein